MLLTRWNPWTPSAWNSFNQLQGEMNRIFERFDNSRQETAVFPLLNLWQQGDTYHLEAELPGLDLADLEVAVTGPNQLTLKGERKSATPDGGTPHRQERAFGSFVRTVSLPTDIDADRVDARLENGVLKISLPKHEAAKPRKIAIKG